MPFQASEREIKAAVVSLPSVSNPLGCDTLAYISMAGVYEAVRGTRERHCDACFTGNYPLAGTEVANDKFALERSLPMVPAGSSSPA